jgi:Zn ribbon nucleic-acid-binding protein
MSAQTKLKKPKWIEVKCYYCKKTMGYIQVWENDFYPKMMCVKCF